MLAWLKCMLKGGHDDETILGTLYENEHWGTIYVDFHRCRRCQRLDLIDMSPVVPEVRHV